MTMVADILSNTNNDNGIRPRPAKSSWMQDKCFDLDICPDLLMAMFAALAAGFPLPIINLVALYTAMSAAGMMRQQQRRKRQGRSLMPHQYHIRAFFWIGLERWINYLIQAFNWL